MKGLSVRDHDRGVLGLRYLYLVRSRRAKGLSLGINLSPNRACNWRCLYCQVPGLARGTSPACDLSRLRQELDLVRSSVALDAVQDVAFSGDGEPTSTPNFDEALAEVAAWRSSYASQATLRLITNGSYLTKPRVQKALARLGQEGGEIWFKLDAVDEAAGRIHGVRLASEQQRRWLEAALCHARTYLQTCVFLLDGRPSYEPGLADYLALLARVRERIAGVMLYGVARKVQVAPSRVAQAPRSVLDALAARIRALGIACEVYA